MKKWLSNLHFSLRPTLVSAVIIAIVLTALGIGIPAYFHSRTATNLLWYNLSREVSAHATEKTLSYFEAGPKFLHFTQRLMQSGEVDVTHPFNILTYCASALKAYPHPYLVYYAKTDGSFFDARRESNGSIRALWREIQPHVEDPQHKTFSREYLLQDNQWVLDRSFWETYDPRSRPFWASGLNNPSGGWTKPYQFSYPDVGIGISYTVPIYSQGQLQGMWMVDYFLDVISQYLRSLQIGEGCITAIVTHQGTIVASSTKEGSIEGSMTNATGHPRVLGEHDRDDALEQAWHYLQNNRIISSAAYSKQFEIGPYLGYIQSFPEGNSIPWNVLTIVPKSFFFNTIIHQTWTAVGWALSLCLLCALLAALFFGSISIRLKKIALEMNKIGNFQLSDQLFAQRKSFIREVKLMNEAIDHMKTGLKSFAKYVPLDLVSKLIQSGHPAKIGGEKQHLTLLFSDLAHFTALSEKKNAEELVQILENYFNEMSHVIQAQHGTVDKYMGNGLMAFWGAPLKTHSHALDACRAALLMREKEKKLNNPSTLSLRIGINTGEAIVGNFGSPTRMNYTTIGDAVNLANRLETLNTFYGTCILLGPDTAKAVSSTLLLRPIDHVAVKGKKQVVLIYELLSEKQEASPNTLSAIAAYKEGLDQYVNQKFQDAIRSFEKAKQLFGGKDTPSDAMIHKARHYLEKPPGPGWKGATILTSTELFPNT